MKNYRQLAAASGIEWSDEHAERQVAVLESLEAALEELKRRLRQDTEPSPVFLPLRNREPGQ